MINQTLIVSTLYRSPGHSINAEQYKQLFGRLNNRFIIGEDFNAKHVHWGSRITKPTGRELFVAASEYECKLVLILGNRPKKNIRLAGYIRH